MTVEMSLGLDRCLHADGAALLQLTPFFNCLLYMTGPVHKCIKTDSKKPLM